MQPVLFTGGDLSDRVSFRRKILGVNAVDPDLIRIARQEPFVRLAGEFREGVVGEHVPPLDGIHARDGIGRLLDGLTKVPCQFQLRRQGVALGTHASELGFERSDVVGGVHDHDRAATALGKESRVTRSGARLCLDAILGA